MGAAPSSSIRPDGSTMWNHALIASYLRNGTNPSNDAITDDEEYEGMGGGGYQYTPGRIVLTVDIALEMDYPSSRDSNPLFIQMSPYPPSDSIIPLPVILESDAQQMDSREPARFEDSLEGSADRDRGDTSSATSRDAVRLFLEHPETANHRLECTPVTIKKRLASARPKKL